MFSSTVFIELEFIERLHIARIILWKRGANEYDGQLIVRDVSTHERL